MSNRLIERLKTNDPEAATMMAKLVELIGIGALILSEANTSTGICCCGDPVESHNMGSGHGPVDMGDYTAVEWLKASREVMEELTK